MKEFTFEVVDGFSARLLHYADLATKIAQAVYNGEQIVLISDMALPVCYMYLDKCGFHLLDAYGRNIVELGDEFVGEHGAPDIYTLLLYI